MSSAASSTCKFASLKTWQKYLKIGLTIGMINAIVLLIVIPIIVVCNIGENSTSEKTTTKPLDGTSKYRLPKNLVPLSYNLHLKAYLPSATVRYDETLNFTFDGNVEVLLLCNQPTNRIVLNIRNLNIDKNSWKLFKITGDQNDGKSNEISIDSQGIKEDKEFEQYSIRLSISLRANARYRLIAVYRGKIGSSTKGFYQSSYEENGVIKYLAVTQFQSTSARTVLPCFDEPEFKAVFNLTLTHPKNMIALSNTETVTTENFQNGWMKTSFASTPKMSTYLLAFVISEFTYKAGKTASGVTFRIWARPSQVNYTGIAVEYGPKLLQEYEKYFDIPFPLKKLDMIAVPDFDSGAMENWGLIVYREQSLLATQNLSSLTSIQWVMQVMAHELAHQWFGNLVTMIWWDDLWLNEGFATYMQYTAVDIVFDGAFKMEEVFVLDAFKEAMAVDQTTSSHALYVEVEKPEEIYEIFDHITYAKGASAVRMLANIVGANIFQKALNHYLTKFSYKSACHCGLWDSLSQVVQNQSLVKDWNNNTLNITELMLSWTRQMGFPLVTLERNYADGSVILDQTWFTIDNDDLNENRIPQNESSRWHILVLYQIGPNPIINGSLWLTPNGEENLPIKLHPKSWILINYGVHGFFRFNYDDANWKLLAEQLITNYKTIETKTRKQLFEDAFTLAKVGRLNYSSALNLLEYLKNETEYSVWQTCLSHLNEIIQFLDSNDSAVVIAKIHTFIKPIYLQVGSEDITQVSFNLTHKLREIVWTYACQFDLEICVQLAQTLFQTYKTHCSTGRSSSNCNKLSPNLRKTVYCTGIAWGSSVQDWQFLWKQYLKEDFSIEKDVLLFGISCTKNETLLEKLLENAVKGVGFRFADVPGAFKTMKENKLARNLLWNYITNNWQDIYEKFSESFSIQYIVEAATSGLKTRSDLALLERFIKDNENVLGSAKEPFARSKKTIRSNIEWIEKYANDVVKWFQNNP